MAALSLRLSQVKAAEDLLQAAADDSDQAEQSIRLLLQIHRVSPNDTATLLQLADAYSFAGQPEAAVAALQEAYRNQPQSILIQQRLGEAYAQAGQLDAAVSIWQVIGYTAGSYVQLGQRAYAAGDLEQAQTYYHLATVMDASLADPWYYQGMIAERSQQWFEARSLYRQASASGRFFQVGLSDVLAREALAVKRQSQQQWPEALELYRLALSRNDFRDVSLQVSAHYEMGHILELMDQDAGPAIQAYRQVIALKPDHEWALMRLGRLLYVAHNDVDGAEAALSAAIRLAPEKASTKWAYRWLGDLYRETGRIDDAVAAYNHALRIDPTDEAVQEWLRQLQAATP